MDVGPIGAAICVGEKLLTSHTSHDKPDEHAARASFAADKTPNAKSPKAKCVDFMRGMMALQRRIFHRGSAPNPDFSP